MASSAAESATSTRVSVSSDAPNSASYLAFVSSRKLSVVCTTPASVSYRASFEMDAWSDDASCVCCGSIPARLLSASSVHLRPPSSMHIRTSSRTGSFDVTGVPDIRMVVAWSHATHVRIRPYARLPSAKSLWHSSTTKRSLLRGVHFHLPVARCFSDLFVSALFA